MKEEGLGCSWKGVCDITTNRLHTTSSFIATSLEAVLNLLTDYFKELFWRIFSFSISGLSRPVLPFCSIIYSRTEMVCEKKGGAPQVHDFANHFRLTISLHSRLCSWKWWNKIIFKNKRCRDFFVEKEFLHCFGKAIGSHDVILTIDEGVEMLL